MNLIDRLIFVNSLFWGLLFKPGRTVTGMLQSGLDASELFTKINLPLAILSSLLLSLHMSIAGEPEAYFMYEKLAAPWPIYMGLIYLLAVLFTAKLHPVLLSSFLKLGDERQSKAAAEQSSQILLLPLASAGLISVVPGLASFWIFAVLLCAEPALILASGRYSFKGKDALSASFTLFCTTAICFIGSYLVMFRVLEFVG